MLKIRRPLGRLIFNMGIAIPGKTVFLIETAPCKRRIINNFHILHYQTRNHPEISVKTFLPLSQIPPGGITSEPSQLSNIKIQDHAITLRGWKFCTSKLHRKTVNTLDIWNFSQCMFRLCKIMSTSHVLFFFVLVLWYCRLNLNMCLGFIFHPQSCIKSTDIAESQTIYSIGLSFNFTHVRMDYTASSAR